MYTSAAALLFAAAATEAAAAADLAAPHVAANDSARAAAAAAAAQQLPHLHPLEGPRCPFLLLQREICSMKPAAANPQLRRHPMATLPLLLLLLPLLLLLLLVHPLLLLVGLVLVLILPVSYPQACGGDAWLPFAAPAMNGREAGVGAVVVAAAIDADARYVASGSAPPPVGARQDLKRMLLCPA